MSFNLTSPVTGAAQTGLTSPTYTLTSDTAPDSNGKQFAVTALGGTQTGVDVHTVASPFTICQWRPKVPRVLGNPNVNTGVINQVPNNTYKTIVRKGVTPLAGQPVRVATLSLVADIPAGSELANPEDIRAMYSLMIGALQQQAAGLGDLAVNGIL